MLAPRYDLCQRGQHLTAVTDSQRQGIQTLEEADELTTSPAVEQNGLGPAFARPQRVTVGEAPAGRDQLELIQSHPTFDNVAHVNVDGGETGPVKGGGHFNLAVYALLPQNRGLGTHAGINEGCCYIFIDIEGELG